MEIKAHLLLPRPSENIGFSQKDCLTIFHHGKLNEPTFGLITPLPVEKRDKRVKWML